MVLPCVLLLALLRGVHGGNGTSGPASLPPVTGDRNIDIVALLSLLVGTILWLLFLVFYFSWLLGYLLTLAVRWKLAKQGAHMHFYLRAVALSPLTGKLLFRDLRIVTPGYTLTILAGYLQFK